MFHRLHQSLVEPIQSSHETSHIAFPACLDLLANRRISTALLACEHVLMCWNAVSSSRLETDCFEVSTHNTQGKLSNRHSATATQFPPLTSFRHMRVGVSPKDRQVGLGSCFPSFQIVAEDHIARRRWF